MPLSHEIMQIPFKQLEKLLGVPKGMQINSVASDYSGARQPVLWIILEKKVANATANMGQGAV